MISSEVERTLVKSPPELWAELSDPAMLSRHLGELGEIRIVRVEPESTVEWAAENTTGTVSIKPSGWGTKVTLSVTRELDRPAPTPQAPSDVEHDPEPIVEPAPERTVVTVTPEPEPIVEPEPSLEPAPTVAAEPTPTIAAEREIEHEPRRGFFARLFSRRPTTTLQSEPIGAAAHTEPRRESTEETIATVEQPDERRGEVAACERSPGAPDAFAAVRAALAPETFAATHLFATQPALERAPALAPPPPERETPTGRASDISAELMAAEEVAAEEVAAVLTAVLDRLGAAHHRPFSRT